MELKNWHGEFTSKTCLPKAGPKSLHLFLKHKVNRQNQEDE